MVRVTDVSEYPSFTLQFWLKYKRPRLGQTFLHLHQDQLSKGPIITDIDDSNHDDDVT